MIFAAIFAALILVFCAYDVLRRRIGYIERDNSRLWQREMARLDQGHQRTQDSIKKALLPAKRKKSGAK